VSLSEGRAGDSWGAPCYACNCHVSEGSYRGALSERQLQPSKQRRPGIANCTRIDNIHYGTEHNEVFADLSDQKPSRRAANGISVTSRCLWDNIDCGVELTSSAGSSLSERSNRLEAAAA